MELSLLLFMAGVGLNAGGGIVEIVQTAGVKLLGAGIVVTLVPTLVGYFFACKINTNQKPNVRCGHFAAPESLDLEVSFLASCRSKFPA
jgi:uncharacterized transporter YbjL